MRKVGRRSMYDEVNRRLIERGHSPLAAMLAAFERREPIPTLSECVDELRVLSGIKVSRQSLSNWSRRGCNSVQEGSAQ